MLCDEIVNNCEQAINYYEGIIKNRESKIELLEKEQQRPKMEWWMWFLIGAAGGALLSK